MLLFLPGLFIFEALAASGLRSIRYAKEITSGVGVKQIVVNDLEKDAFDSIERNLAHNEVPSSLARANLAVSPCAVLIRAKTQLRADLNAHVGALLGRHTSHDGSSAQPAAT